MMNLSDALLPLLFRIAFAMTILPTATSFTNSPAKTRRISKSIHDGRIRPLHAFELETANTASAIEAFFQTQPYVAAFLTCSFKASAADIIAQQRRSLEEVRIKPVLIEANQGQTAPSFDISRNLGFLLYGGLYTGMTQNYIYNVIYPSWFNGDDSWTFIAKQVCVDNLLFAPFLCLPAAYAFKAVFMSISSGTSVLDLQKNVQKGLENYRYDVLDKGLLTKYWSIWIPVQFLTFGVIPCHFRVSFVAAISFFWIFILSNLVATERDIEKDINTANTVIAD